MYKQARERNDTTWRDVGEVYRTCDNNMQTKTHHEQANGKYKATGFR